MATDPNNISRLPEPEERRAQDLQKARRLPELKSDSSVSLSTAKNAIRILYLVSVLIFVILALVLIHNLTSGLIK